MRRPGHNYGPHAALFAFATPGVMYGLAARHAGHLSDAPHVLCHCYHRLPDLMNEAMVLRSSLQSLCAG